MQSQEVPLLMIQGGTHPGESDGKDAGFIALRELLEGSAAVGTLERMAILFVPAFNQTVTSGTGDGTGPIRTGRKRRVGARPRRI